MALTTRFSTAVTKAEPWSRLQGLSGSRRLVDEFDIESAVGKGMRVTVVKGSRY